MSKKFLNNQKKSTTVILLVAVLGIWGLLIYQIFGKKEHQQQVSDTVLNTQINLKQVQKKESKPLYLSYQDPFKLPKNKKRTTKKRSPRKPKKTENFRFPTIVYEGFIGSKNNIEWFLISINRQQEMLQVNDEHREVYLVKGDAKEIKIKYQNHFKTIALK